MRIYECSGVLPSWKLTWKPQEGPIRTTVPFKGGYMGFHVSLGGVLRFFWQFEEEVWCWGLWFRTRSFLEALWPENFVYPKWA